MISAYFDQLIKDSGFDTPNQILALLQPVNHKIAYLFGKKPRRRHRVIPSPEKPEQPKKPKFDVAGYYAELKAKREEAAAQVKQYAKAQARREAYREAHRNKLEQLAKEEAEEQLRRQQEKTASLQQLRSAQLEQLRLKKESRLQTQTLSQSFSKSRLTRKPLYKLLEERHQSNVDLLEQRKAELAQLRAFNAPLRRKHIKEHIDWYNQRKLEHKPPEVAKTTTPFVSPLGAKLVEEDRKLLKQQEKTKQILAERSAKRQMYANTVKAEFAPTVDPKKTQEIQLRLHKRPSQVKQKDLLPKEPSVWRPKEYPRNSMLPPPPEKREPKVVDYLAELREKHQSNSANPSAIFNSDLAQEKKMRKLKQLEERLEFEMRKQDIQLQAGIPDAHILNARESTNNVLISSIRAKLDVLHTVTTPN